MSPVPRQHSIGLPQLDCTTRRSASPMKSFDRFKLLFEELEDHALFPFPCATS